MSSDENLNKDVNSLWRWKHWISKVTIFKIMFKEEVFPVSFKYHGSSLRWGKDFCKMDQTPVSPIRDKK